jgi:TatD DNase family protein
MNLFDSHIHADLLVDRQPPEDAATYRAMVPGIIPAATRRAIATAARWEFHGAAIHPWYLAEAVDITEVEALLSEPRVRAIGETGLDHYRHGDDQRRDEAARWFADHVRLALEHDLPIVVHCVRAHERCLRVLRDVAGGRARGVVHAFSGSPETAMEYAREGFAVGIGSAVTRERSRRVRRAAAEVSMDCLLVETDAPFLAAGARSRGDGRASDLVEVVRTIATLRDEAPEVVAERTFQNATSLFDPDPA